MKKIFIIIIIILLFILINILLNINYIEKYNDKNIFLDSKSLLNFLIKNNDNYYQTFFENDFKVRNIKNINEYFEMIQSSVTDFTMNEIKKIKKCIKNADLFFSKINYEWFDGEKCINLQWIIGCVKGRLYENGLPHTRGDVIILSKKHLNEYSEKKLTNTLIHEKVHVYQKKFKLDVEKYIISNNYKKIKKRDIIDNVRANPDLDNWIYKDAENNINTALYNKNPTSVEDIKYVPQNFQMFEHPYENMAIFIENKNK